VTEDGRRSLGGKSEEIGFSLAKESPVLNIRSHGSCCIHTTRRSRAAHRSPLTAAWGREGCGTSTAVASADVVQTDPQTGRVSF